MNFPHIVDILILFPPYVKKRLCVRLRILQICTHLKMVPNRFHSHHYNTFHDFLFIYLCVQRKKVPNRYIADDFRYILTFSKLMEIFVHCSAAQ